ncbi:leucine-rich repeat domain-containing protein [Carboxylicivirga marina]|uniref:Leucine-rich repeat domain-containing protein n=1 Tax=Carboxylicivirga marina TaxID=2800988 RepID=A0ABS1HQS3_9BACT|nr:leucine-rich repeat domain-containing protein [Carboxylicivirga marina]MBK3520026.1 leucine-rich repeat domain-containing protein [Carboxylicivirga marina]
MKIILRFGILALMLSNIKIYSSPHYLRNYFLNENYSRSTQETIHYKYGNSDGILKSSDKITRVNSDTTKYMLEINGKWVYTIPSVPPTYIESIQDLREKVAHEVRAPMLLMSDNISGYMFFSFIVDTLGIPTSFKIEKDLCEGCGDYNLEVLKNNIKSWIPASINGIKYNSKFVFPLKFESEGSIVNSLPESIQSIFDGKLIDEVVIRVYGINKTLNNSTVDKTTIENLLNPTYYELQKALNVKNNVKNLNLSSNNLNSFPVEILEMIHLETLDLSDNRIQNLPGNIQKLKILEVFILNKNELYTIDENISLLGKLKALSISNNKFQSFPNQILKLKKLQVLDISNNNINQVPPEIISMSKLRSLAIVNTEIRSLPEEFFQLKKLEKLFINKNQLKSSEIEKLQSKLKKLEIIYE